MYQYNIYGMAEKWVFCQLREIMPSNHCVVLVLRVSLTNGRL
jgi:hypothetical protein